MRHWARFRKWFALGNICRGTDSVALARQQAAAVAGALGAIVDAMRAHAARMWRACGARALRTGCHLGVYKTCCAGWRCAHH